MIFERRLMATSDNRVHVMPTGDLREHDASVECWCGPTQDEEEPRVFLHHSMDGREAFENGERRVS